MNYLKIYCKIIRNAEKEIGKEKILIFILKSIILFQFQFMEKMIG
jgi:hypothetical protein